MNASRVEEVLARIKGVKHNVGTEPRTYYLAEQADLDALIAAVRADTLAKVRRAMEQTATHIAEVGMPPIDRAAIAYRNDLSDALAALAALSDLAEGK